MLRIPWAFLHMASFQIPQDRFGIDVFEEECKQHRGNCGHPDQYAGKIDKHT